MRIEIYLISLMLFLLSATSVGQEKYVYCIKHSYFGMYDNEFDSTESKFLRMVSFDICDGTSSLFKSWNYSKTSETFSQKLSYTNQAFKQNIELNWYKDSVSADENYSFYLKSFDSITDNYFSLHIWVSNNEIGKVKFEMWRCENDSIIKKFYRFGNPEPIITQLQNWMIKDRNSRDSISFPQFPELLSLRMEFVAATKFAYKLGNINEFKQSPKFFQCGDKKTPEYIRQNSKLIKRRRKLLWEKRVQIERVTETIYDIYFKSS